MSIELREVTKTYGPTRALDGVSLRVGDDARVVVFIGPSGGGKSTLLRLLGGLEPPTAGTIVHGGEALPRNEDSLRRFRRSNGFLFQSFNLFPHLTALANISLPLEKVHGMGRRDATEKAHTTLERFAMGEHASKRPAELSGGQQQRVALARAMAHDPQLLLLDEPTSALDPERKAEVLDTVQELCAAGQRIVLTTHEMGFARQVADRVAFLADGRIVEEGEATSLFESPRSPAVSSFLERILRW